MPSLAVQQALLQCSCRCCSFFLLLQLLHGNTCCQHHCQASWCCFQNWCLVLGIMVVGLSLGVAAAVISNTAAWCCCCFPVSITYHCQCHPHFWHMAIAIHCHPSQLLPPTITITANHQPLMVAMHHHAIANPCHTHHHHLILAIIALFKCWSSCLSAVFCHCCSFNLVIIMTVIASPKSVIVLYHAAWQKITVQQWTRFPL